MADDDDVRPGRLAPGDHPKAAGSVIEAMRKASRKAAAQVVDDDARPEVERQHVG